MGDDLIPLFIVLLAGITSKCDWAFSIGVAMLQKLLQFTKLAVCKSVHWINHNRLNSLAAAIS